MQVTSPSSPVFFEASSTRTTILKDAHATEPNTLDQLQTAEQVLLLDKIDELRNKGLSHHGISLPQLIVCGDQSSGKSSLLQRLTRLRFPIDGSTFKLQDQNETSAKSLILSRNMHYLCN
jgi:ribosome biogenesis GTPase A